MFKKMMNYLLLFFCFLSLPAAATSAPVNVQGASIIPLSRTLCVFDVVGKQGENFQIMEEYRLAAINWGVELDLKVYTDERIASEDFKAGLCDGVSITGMRARSFNSFTGSLDSIGSIPSYEHLRVALGMLASPQMARFMRENGYEVAGIIPGGAAHLFVNDRKIDSVDKMLGKRVAVLDFDASQALMVASIGASAVSASIATLGPMFNNGTVDIIAAPAIAYDPLELYKGLGQHGAIGRQAVGQLTFQLIIHPDRFPENFAQLSRDYVFAQYDFAVTLINNHTRAIPAATWLDISHEDQQFYNEMFRQTRLMLKQEGFYNANMLKFLSRVRCKMEPQLAECTAADRE